MLCNKTSAQGMMMRKIANRDYNLCNLDEEAHSSAICIYPHSSAIASRNVSSV